MAIKAELKKIKLFVLDMDGTFYLSSRIIDGSLDFIAKLRETGRSFLFFTNNSSQTDAFYRRKLAAMGCEIGESEILTSGDVTIDYLKHEHPGKSVYLLGTDELRGSFAAAGIPLVDENPQLVVVGFDKTICYETANKACHYIRNGTPFISTHPDLNCPTEDGFILDCGSMCAMITASTGVTPKYLGKPCKETLDAVMHLTGFAKDEIAFVGDRLYTDIAIGVNNGVASILVLTGETTPGDLAESQVKPDFVYDSLRAIAEEL